MRQHLGRRLVSLSPGLTLRPCGRCHSMMRWRCSTGDPQADQLGSLSRVTSLHCCRMLHFALGVRGRLRGACNNTR